MIKNFYRTIATFGGIGYLPVAPGTWAALITALIWFPAFRYHHTGTIPLLACLLILITGIIASEKYSGKKGKDPSEVVIDEVSGMTISLLWIPVSISSVLIALILFRFFDIAKPLGIKKMEKFKGGTGIMMDDVLAGIYSNLLLRLILFAGII